MTRFADSNSYDLDYIDRVAAFASTLEFMPPVIISPPSSGDCIWTIKSETANRPERQTIHFDAERGEPTAHDRFSDRHWVDQLIGQGIALHEGQRFGWLNQLVALVATSALVMLSFSGLVLWWRRRDGGGLSPPATRRTRPDVSTGRLIVLASAVLMLGVYLPLFGASLLVVLLLDWCLFSKVKPIAVWMGRRPQAKLASVILLLFIVGCSDVARPITGGSRGTLSSGGQPMSQMQVNVFGSNEKSATAIGRGYVASDGSFELVGVDASSSLVLLPGTGLVGAAIVNLLVLPVLYGLLAPKQIE